MYSGDAYRDPEVPFLSPTFSVPNEIIADYPYLNPVYIMEKKD